MSCGTGAAADWAFSGIVPLTGRAGEPPLVPPGRAATYAWELAELIHELTSRTRFPVRVDGAGLLSERAAFTGHGRRGRISAGGACRLLPSADGWAAVSCARPDDPDLLGALVGRVLPADPWPTVSAWLRDHSGAQLAERAELLGIAAGPVAPSKALDPDDPDPSLPPPPPRAPGAGSSPSLVPRPVDGLLVVDFSALWAGPLCAQLLGLAGARVVKVETPTRPDGARLGQPDFYRLLHAGHRSVVLDPDTASGRRALSALVAAADIVIEASRPRALARFGLDADAAVASGTTWISLTAAGRASGRVGFGDDVAAGAGLVAREADGTPVFCGDAIADPLTGLTAAVRALTAPAHGGGFLHDIAMRDVVAATLDGPRTPPPPVRRTDTSTGTSTSTKTGTGWAVDTGERWIPVAAPRRREPVGQAPSTGADTVDVLRGLGIPRP
ncbi:CoA transferase [Streptomyces sp. NPDC059893]|uniref:CoA transferase n=1 Tax=Streptomyces sp. NPDC059893 TaxID=3346990 RepID=UPI00364F0626